MLKIDHCWENRDFLLAVVQWHYRVILLLQHVFGSVQTLAHRELTNPRSVTINVGQFPVKLLTGLMLIYNTLYVLTIRK